MTITIVEYLTHIYPWSELERFLTRHGDPLCKREFAIEGEFYKRYVVAKNANDLKSQVISMPGVKSFHIGPVYSDVVTRRTTLSWPVRRELVFDVDLTDYDNLELSSPEGGVDVEACDKAWPICSIAIFVIQRILQHAFGYTQFVVVYSGRRGAHIYVCDDAAMNLTDEGRTAVASFLDHSLTKDKKRCTDQMRGMMKMYGLSDAIRFAFEEMVVKDMDLFGDLNQRLGFVDRLGLSEASLPILANMAEDVLDKQSGADAWEFLKSKVASLPQDWMRDRLDDVILALVWPRIDFNVTKSRGHLLKAPYIAHPKSGRVAVPINVADFCNFSPAAVPSLRALDSETLKATFKFMRPCSIHNNQTPTTDQSASLPEDVDMEDLMESSPEQTAPARKRGFVRKRSQLSQVFP